MKVQNKYEYICTYQRRQWHPTPVLLPGKSHGRRTWWATVHGVTKSQTRLRDFTFTFHFHSLEKEMATHSSVLAWRIPGMGEPGGLLSMGSHRVGTRLKRLSSSSSSTEVCKGSCYAELLNFNTAISASNFLIK